MIFKLAIIGVILLGGGIVFANEINQFLPETTANLFDSVKKDFGKIKDETVQSAEKVEGTLVTVSNEVNDFKESSTKLLSENVKEITDSTQQSIKEITDSTQENVKEITDSTQEAILGGNGNNRNKNTISKEEDDNGNTISFETLSLTTTQHSDNSVMLHYEDTSSKTFSVSVTLRTTERELFSGIFYSSMFETFVNDASNTPYFIDMLVEHQEYGTITSSVYNPIDSPNTIINGVFFQS